LMDIVGAGKRVKIYIGESDHWEGQPLYLALLQLLRAEGCAGATVHRGIAGFGAHSRIHTATLVRLSEDLPIVVEWIDTPDRVERVLPKVTPMITQGIITVDDTWIAHHRNGAVDDISNRLLVREVMTREVASVQADLPLREAAELLVGRDYRALPVVDSEDRVVGIVTNGNLVERGGLAARVELLGILTPEQLARELAAVEKGKTVADVMTSPVETVGPNTSLADVAHRMVQRRLKRLPVVDASGKLIGVISRVDLLRTRAEAYARPRVEKPPSTGRTIGDIARTDIPVVSRTASLGDVVNAIVSTRLNRALVVDDERRILGVITDAEMLRRLSPEDHPSILRILTSRLPFVHHGSGERTDLAHALGTTAEELMDPNIPTVSSDLPLGEAIEIMLRERRKLIPVVDTAGRLLGAADRADMLRTLVAIDGERNLA
jgi:CBS domain-containing protein